MATITSGLKAFAYTGRENGVMVVGSVEALQSLAAVIQAHAVATQEPKVERWPHHVASSELEVGPFRDSQHWRLSFHVEGATPAEMVVPLQASGPAGPLVVAVLALAAIGCVSIVRWALNVF
jgi:hypothetical protein